MRERVFTLLRISAARFTPIGQDLHPHPWALMRVSAANLITYGDRLRMICIGERYRSLTHCVRDPRHTCIAASMRAGGGPHTPLQ